MKPFRSADFLEVGYPAEAPLQKMVVAANQYISRGISSRKYILKLLCREFGEPDPLLKMRREPLSFSRAITAQTPKEKKNLGHVEAKMRELMRCPKIVAGTLMPDACPAGVQPAEIPVGGGIVVENAIIPAAHSADICCSMFVSFYESSRKLEEEMEALGASTRFGKGGRPLDQLVDHSVIHEEIWDNPFLKGLKSYAEIHMADQGDGNHFAYLGEVTFTHAQLQQLREAGYTDLAESFSEDGETTHKFRALVTHHGSRGLGAHLYQRGLKAALKHTRKVAQGIPEAAAWLDYETEEGQAYWEALQYVSRWTRANHEAIHERFLSALKTTANCAFGNEHNFVWKRGEKFYHGKGATPAWGDCEGRMKLGLIPLNMAEPILIVLGKDQAEFLSFAPHGAGRNQSRRKFKRDFFRRATSPKALEEGLKNQTVGLDVRWYLGEPDISEAPVGYKNAESIREQIRHFDLAEIVAEIQPRGTLMAGSAKCGAEEEEFLTPKQKRQIQHRAERRTQKQFLRKQ